MQAYYGRAAALRRGSEGGPQNGLLTGLLTYWALDETSGSRADSHENGYTLSEGGTLGTADGLVYAKAALFAADADNYLIRARASAPLLNFNSSTPFTIAVWCYPTAWAAGSDSPDYYRFMVSFNDGSYAAGGYELKTTNGGQVHVLLGKTGGVPQYSYHTTLYATLNAWQLVAWTHNSGSLLYYLNGSTVTDTNSYAFTSATGHDFRIGISKFDKYNYAGRLGPVAIWSRALSVSELGAFYNGGSGLTYAELD